jgi:hypothetical protein
VFSTFFSFFTSAKSTSNTTHPLLPDWESFSGLIVHYCIWTGNTRNNLKICTWKFDPTLYTSYRDFMIHT